VGAAGKSLERIKAEIGLSPIMGGALTPGTFAKGTFGDIDPTDSVAVLMQAVAKVRAGDLSGR
jgi:hypothetical protein